MASCNIYAHIPSVETQCLRLQKIKALKIIHPSIRNACVSGKQKQQKNHWKKPDENPQSTPHNEHVKDNDIS
jgi:hypothetical protein